MRNPLLILIVLLMAGCQPMAVQQDRSGPVPVTLRIDDAAYWLEEWQRLMDLPADQVQQAIELREQEFRQDPRDVRARLRLALMLVEGPAAVRDTRRAQSLIEGFDPARASASSKALAALLDQVVRERIAASDKIASLKQGLSASEQRVKELERQLQELTDIEQSIQQRETPVERKEKE